MKRVLLVDDTPSFRTPVALMLKTAGFDVLTAGNGQQALESVRDRQPDLILLDVAMPVMDGIEFIRRLRADASLAQPPIVLLTAVAEKDHILRAARLGVGDYLLKSDFSLRRLLAHVFRALGQCELAAEPGRAAAHPCAG